MKDSSNSLPGVRDATRELNNRIHHELWAVRSINGLVADAALIWFEDPERAEHPRRGLRSLNDRSWLPDAGTQWRTMTSEFPSSSASACTIGEACDATGLGRTKLYMLIEASALQTITVGRRRLVIMESQIGKARKFHRRCGVDHGHTECLGFTTLGDAIRKGLKYALHNAVDIVASFAGHLEPAAWLRRPYISAIEAIEI